MGYYTPNLTFLWGYTSAKKQRRPRNTFVLKKFKRSHDQIIKHFERKKGKQEELIELV